MRLHGRNLYIISLHNNNNNNCNNNYNIILYTGSYNIRIGKSGKYCYNILRRL